MTVLRAIRSPGRTWLAAILSVPFVILGLDLLLLPKLFPQYVRRLDLLADEMGLNRITANGPEEPWGLFFLVAGAGLLLWALKDLLFPKELLAIDEHGIAFSSLLGPAGGRMSVPHSEILDAAPAVLIEGSDRSPAVAIRVADPSRLPSSPWGAVWVDDHLFIRTDGWTASPRQIVALLTDDRRPGVAGYELDLEPYPPAVTILDEDPTDTADPRRAFEGRSRAYLGGVFMLGAALLASFLWIAGTDTKAFFLLPAALGAFGGVLFINGYREYLEST